MDLLLGLGQADGAPDVGKNPHGEGEVMREATGVLVLRFTPIREVGFADHPELYLHGCGFVSGV